MFSSASIHLCGGIAEPLFSSGLDSCWSSSGEGGGVRVVYARIVDNVRQDFSINWSLRCWRDGSVVRVDCVVYKHRLGAD